MGARMGVQPFSSAGSAPGLEDTRRRQLVAAAAELYRELGWDALTVDAVAKRAGLSRGLVYCYFRGRNHLLVAIAAHAMRLFCQQVVKDQLEGESGLAHVLAISRSYFEFAHRDSISFDACARLEAQPSASPAQSGPADYIEACSRTYAAIRTALAAGQQDGSVRNDLGDLLLTARVLWGFIHGFVLVSIRRRGAMGVDDGEAFETAMNMLREMLAPRRTDS